MAVSTETETILHSATSISITRGESISPRWDDDIQGSLVMRPGPKLREESSMLDDYFQMELSS
jgi:hypothetical protein